MSIGKTILEAVGNTPLVELQNIPSADDAGILVKVEAVNVGGSIKFGRNQVRPVVAFIFTL
jgi:cysteine synthase